MIFLGMGSTPLMSGTRQGMLSGRRIRIVSRPENRINPVPTGSFLPATKPDERPPAISIS
jgi:hypothetical protein